MLVDKLLFKISGSKETKSKLQEKKGFQWLLAMAVAMMRFVDMDII